MILTPPAQACGKVLAVAAAHVWASPPMLQAVIRQIERRLLSAEGEWATGG